MPEENKNEMLDDNKLNQEDFKADTDFEDDDSNGGSAEEKSKKSQPNEDENAKTQTELEEEAKKQAEAKAKEEKEKNAKYAKMRREKEEAEAKAKEEKLEKKIRTEIELENNKVNPYTKLPIKDAYDLEIYKQMKKFDDEGKDPLVEFANQFANNQRNEATEKENKAKNEEARKTKIAEEIETFRRDYPNVDVMSVVKDNDMFKWAQDTGKANRWTLSEIYEGYNSYKVKLEAEKKEKEREAKAKKEAEQKTNQPSSGSSDDAEPKDINKMSREEFDAYFSKKYS